MKLTGFLLLLFTFLCAKQSYAQQWNDTLLSARKAYMEGRYNQALKKYKSAERLAPNDVNLNQELAQAAYRAGDFTTAERCFEKSSSSNNSKTDQIRIAKNLGQTRLKLNDSKGAVEAFKTALRLNPNDEKARQLLVQAIKKEKQQQEKESKQAKEKNNSTSENSSSVPKKQQKSTKNETQIGEAEKQKGQLKDKQADRKLDELTRQEKGIKQRLDGSKGTKSGSKVRQDW